MTRLLLILSAVTGVMALTACGGSESGTSGSTSSSNQQDKAYEGALNFAKCMREHGVDMADPKRDANGGVQMLQSRRAGDGVTDAKMQAAQKACQKHLEAGGGPARDPAREARMQDALFAYARCMRSEGIDMPDPQVSGNKVTMKVGGEGGELGRAGGNPESPKFKAADKACHHHLAEMEKDAPKAGGK
jgi:hypothetical protein